MCSCQTLAKNSPVWSFFSAWSAAFSHPSLITLSPGLTLSSSTHQLVQNLEHCYHPPACKIKWNVLHNAVIHNYFKNKTRCKWCREYCCSFNKQTRDGAKAPLIYTRASFSFNIYALKNTQTSLFVVLSCVIADHYLLDDFSVENSSAVLVFLAGIR